MDPVRAYHECSKHHLNRYAPGPGWLDWSSQPDPFRRFAGASECELPVLDADLPVRWDDLYDAAVAPAPINAHSVACLLQMALGLSAWKSYGGNRWALRCNPSSGNLHPTEGYLICPDLPGVPAGVHHYRSDRHALEHRCAAPLSWQGGFLLALTAVHWREAWKYGVRAFRYCQHDCGHALAAIAYAARVLGWQTRLLLEWSDDQIAALSGVDRSMDFAGAEGEDAEALVWIGSTAAPPAPEVLAVLEGGVWTGIANSLSAYRRDWPDIPRIAAATRTSAGQTGVGSASQVLSRPSPASGELASRLIRNRRSAQAFDGVTAVSCEAWFRMLDAVMPRPACPPWSLLDLAPAVHLVLFVHRVTGLAPGIYCLVRARDAVADLRAAMATDWLWEAVPGSPAHLPLYLLAPMDVRKFAAAVSCHQDIAADSAFALAMLARYDDLGTQPWRYRWRFHEAGMIGQVLYLEAEAAGVRGTGIGCYFDDEVHRALGLDTARYQDFYHFAIGGPLIDGRLATDPGYAHLVTRRPVSPDSLRQ